MSFVTSENNRINYKHGTYNRILSETTDWKDYLERTWKYFQSEKEWFNNWLVKNPIVETDAQDVQRKKVIEHNIHRRYPHKHLSSIFVKLYIIAEVELGSFCHFYQMHFEIELTEIEQNKLKQNRDNSYWLKRLLIHKGQKLTSFIDEYNMLIQFKKIRDNLSHQKEHVLISKPKDDTFRMFLNKCEGIDITNVMWVKEGAMHTYFIYSDELIKSLLSTIDSFFKKVLDLTYESENSNLIKTSGKKV